MEKLLSLGIFFETVVVKEYENENFRNVEFLDNFWEKCIMFDSSNYMSGDDREILSEQKKGGISMRKILGVVALSLTISMITGSMANAAGYTAFPKVFNYTSGAPSTANHIT